MEIRSTTDGNALRQLIAVVRAALLSAPPDEVGFEKFQESDPSGDWLSMWDGDDCVGHVGGFRFDTTVPGGARVPTSGVTAVGVRPTHTRRGVMSQLLERLLREARDRGQVIASLRASEAVIYGRFGFGLATDEVAVEVVPDRARPLRLAGAPGSIRLLLGDESADVIPELYARVGRWRVGTINRYDWHWSRLLESVNRPAESFGQPATFVAVHTDPDGNDDGLVKYTVGWADGFGESPRGEGKVHDLWGADDAVERALWGYLLDLDLVVRWEVEARPSDDPIRRVFRDPRGYRTVARSDELWVRLLDADAALRARTYGPVDDAVTIAVTDPLFEQNCGTWRISADGAASTDGPADVTADINAISAAYLGGVSWRDMAASGEIDGSDDTTLAALDALFLVRPIPFCGTEF